MAVKAKEFRYAIGLDRTGQITADGRSPLDLAEAWTPEHLVLAGLARDDLREYPAIIHSAGDNFCDGNIDPTPGSRERNVE